MTSVKQARLQTELHTKRQPPSPQQVKARQVADAEQDRAAVEAKLPAKAYKYVDAIRTRLPTSPASTAVATDNKSTVDRILDEHAPSFLPMIQFDGKEGRFVLHATDTALDPDTRYIAHANGTWLGHVKFNGPGEQPTRVGGPLYGEGFEVPDRDSLGDTDPAQWPISDLSGRPEDPFKLQFVLPLENIDTGEEFAFATMSPTGRVAMGRFLRAFNRMKLLYPDQLPIVQLRPSSYEHKKFGKVNIPAIITVGRATGDGSQAPNARPLSLAEEMDDELPSFEPKKF